MENTTELSCLLAVGTFELKLGEDTFLEGFLGFGFQNCSWDYFIFIVGICVFVRVAVLLRVDTETLGDKVH